MSAVTYLFDEDLNGRIVRGVRRRLPMLNAFTVYEAGLKEAEDPVRLEQAAIESRIVVSHDHSTMRAYAEDRLKTGLSMTGLFLVRQAARVGRVIDDLVLIVEASSLEEWDGKIIFLPL